MKRLRASRVLHSVGTQDGTLVLVDFNHTRSTILSLGGFGVFYDAIQRCKEGERSFTATGITLAIVARDHVLVVELEMVVHGDLPPIRSRIIRGLLVTSSVSNLALAWLHVMLLFFLFRMHPMIWVDIPWGEKST